MYYSVDNIGIVQQIEQKCEALFDQKQGACSRRPPSFDGRVGPSQCGASKSTPLVVNPFS